MTATEIMKQLKKMGNEGTVRIYKNHGAPDDMYGVKVADLKTIQKKVKKNHELSLELYDTGNSDAMYLAGLIAEPEKMNKTQLQKWAKNAGWYMISEYTVAWVTSESKYGWELGMKWIDNKSEKIASSGWATLSSMVALHPDEQLDIDALRQLLKRVEANVHDERNRVRYTMNGFVIAVGSYVKELTKEAMAVGKKIGKVSVDMGGTACKVPLATEYIDKVKAKGYIGKKRKSAIC